MDTDFSDNFKVNGKFSIKKASTSYNGKLTKEEGEQMLIQEKEKLRELQEKLYADGGKSLLVVLQAMDAAGKDSMIEHVFGGVNPQGCNVTSFKTPSSKEYSHDFLWRHYLALPQKGMIGIFNRSHYESVLVCKVHPEYNLSEKTWSSVKDFDSKFWENRYESIRNFEKHLSQNGTTVVKIFLNVSQVKIFFKTKDIPASKLFNKRPIPPTKNKGFLGFKVNPAFFSQNIKLLIAKNIYRSIQIILILWLSHLELI